MTQIVRVCLIVGYCLLTLSVVQLEDSALGPLANQRVQLFCIAFLAMAALLARLLYSTCRFRSFGILGAPIMFVCWSILTGIANIDVASQWSVLGLYSALLLLPLTLPPSFRDTALQGVVIASLFQIIFALVTQDFLVTLSGVRQLSGGAHPNILGLMACVVAISSLYFLFISPRRIFHRLVLFLMFTLGTLSLVLSVSRSGLISFVFATCIFLVLSVRRLWLSFAAITTASAFALLISGRWVMEVVTGWFVRGDASNLSSLTGRTDIWDLSLHMIKEKPVLGWGFGALYHENYSAGMFLRLVEGTNTHNAWMQFALETGLVGLALITFFLIVAIRQTLRLNHRIFRNYCLALYVLLFVNGLVSASFATIGVACLLLTSTVAMSCWNESHRRQGGLNVHAASHARAGNERLSVSA